MIVALTSASGAPGVTTTALGVTIALATPSPRAGRTGGAPTRSAQPEPPVTRTAIYVDADPVGGSTPLAGHFKGFHVPTITAVDLLMASHDATFREVIDGALIPLAPGAFVLPGARNHRQAASAVTLWAPLAVDLALRPDTDVVADLGRLGLESYATAFLTAADAIALLVTGDLPSIAATRQWAESFVVQRESEPDMAVVGLIVVGPGRPYGVREIESALGLPVWASLPYKPRAAAWYSRGTGSGDRLRPSYNACAAALRRATAARAAVLEVARA